MKQTRHFGVRVLLVTILAGLFLTVLFRKRDRPIEWYYENPIAREYYFAGPGGTYGFYEYSSDHAPFFQFSSVVFVADRGYGLPFSVTHSFILCGTACILLVGASLWYHRRHGPRDEKAAS